MKLIDLLVKIAKGEEVPKRIKVFGNEFEFLYQSGDKTYFDNDGDYLFSDVYNWENNLNEEIKIIEEKPKKIEKLDLYEDLQDILNSPDKSIVLNAIHKCLLVEKYKINELIDYLLEKESDK